MKTDFDTIINRRGTYSLKWEGAALFDPNIHWNDETIPMMIADMDFACSPAIQTAMHRVADHQIYGYTWHTDPSYMGSIVDWYKRRYDTELKEEWIAYSNGSVAAINCAVETFTNVGDGVIIMRPVYGHFNGMIEEETHRSIAACNLINDNGYYTVDWEDFEAKCAAPVNRAFILCSPANPVGRVWKKEELAKMAEICRKHHVLLIADEIHSDILRKGQKHIPIIKATDDYSNIILVTGINKSFNVAGLLCSNVIIPDDNLRAVFMSQFGFRMPTPFAVGALIAAYDGSEEWLDELNEYLDANIEFAIDFIKTHMPKVKVWYPEGTYMLWLDFRAYGFSDEEVHRKIYVDANVVLQDGIVHDPEYGQCFQRMCITLPKSQLQEALERISLQFWK